MKINFVKISFFIFSITLLLLLATFSCTPTKNEVAVTENNKTAVHVFLTDDPSLYLDKVFLHILKLEIKVEDSGTNNSGGWFTLQITPGVFDILRFRNGLDTLFANGSIPTTGKLQKIRMTLGNNNSVVYQGNSFALEVKDNHNEVEANLESSNVDFVAPNQFRFWIDFDVQHSIQMKSNNKFELKSSIKIFSKQKTGTIEGKILPAIAHPVVYAINGSDTSSAIPENNGSFKIQGLKTGVYKLLVDATANNYRDTILSPVNVFQNESTKLNTIQLHL